MSIVQAMLEQVEFEVEKSGQEGRVTRLDLVIGRMSGVHADSVVFAFELLAPGTIADGAELRIAEPKAELHCARCGACEPMDELIVVCPQCGSADVTIQGGQDLLLQSIELEEA